MQVVLVQPGAGVETVVGDTSADAASAAAGHMTSDSIITKAVAIRMDQQARAGLFLSMC